MRKSEKAIIERAVTTYGGPDYLRTTAHFPVPPYNLIQLFSWENFIQTQKTIDPFFESCQLIMNISHSSRIFRKTTKRPLIFPKRVFHTAMSEYLQSTSFHAFINPAWHQRLPFLSTNLFVNISKGTVVSSLMDVHWSDRDNDSLYVRSFQDFIAWFVDDQKGNELVVRSYIFPYQAIPGRRHLPVDSYEGGSGRRHS